MAVLTLSDGRQLTDTGQRDARGFAIFTGPDGSLFTDQNGKIVLSRKASISDSLPSTGNPQADDLLRGLEEGISTAEESGKFLNREITFNPGEIQGFLDQAVSELSPFFQSQFKSLRKDLEEGLGELQQSFDLQAESQAQQFRGGLTDIRESEAERGRGISGIKATKEREFAEAAGRGIKQTQQAVEASARRLGTQTERVAGTRNLQDVNIPGIRKLDISGFTPGITFAKQAATRSQETKPLFQLSKDVTGTLESQFEQKKQARSTELQTAERSRRLNVI